MNLSTSLPLPLATEIESSKPSHTRRAGKLPSLLIMAFVVVGAEEGWRNERPWQSSSWVLTPFPVGGGTKPRGWLMPRSLTRTWLLQLWTDGRWELCECDESELRAIPWISTQTVTDWCAASGSSAQLPEGRRSPLLFQVGASLTGYILIILNRAASYLRLKTHTRNSVLVNIASDFFLYRWSFAFNIQQLLSHSAFILLEISRTNDLSVWGALLKIGDNWIETNCRSWAWHLLHSP